MADRLDNINRERPDILKAQALEQHKRRLAYQQCFETPAGRKVLLDLLTRCYEFSSSYTRNADTHFNEGARAVVLEIKNLVPGLVGAVLNSYYQEEEALITRELAKQEAGL